MRSTVKKLIVIFTVLCMLLASLPVQAASPVISKKAITLTVGKSTTLKVKNAKGKIKWKSSNSKIASVSKRGKVTGKKTGKAKITATVNKRNYNCTVIVKADRKVTKVTNVKLNKKNITLKAGKVYTLKASVSPSKASNKALVWKSSNNSIASVNSKGVVSAKKAGTVTITATAKDGSKKKASCKVTVKKTSKPASDKRVSKIIVSSKKSVNINGTLQLKVSVQPSGLSKTFTWKSDNTKIATVSSTGLVKGVSAGTVKITVTTNDKWKDSISVYITVNKPQNTPTPKPVHKTITGIEAVCGITEASSIDDIKNHLTVYEKYSDGTKNEVKSYSVKTESTSDGYKCTVTITGTSFSTVINVKKKGSPSSVTLESIEASCKHSEVESGYTFKTSDFDVKGVYSDGSKKNIGFKVDISYSNGAYKAIITAENHSVTLTILVKKSSTPEVTGMTYFLNPPYVYVDENLASGQLKVTAKYSDGSQKEVTDYACDFKPQSSAGTYTFNVTWGTFKKAISITIKEKTVPTPALTGLDAQYNNSYVYVEDPIDASKIILTGTYSDGSTKQITDYTYDFTPATEHLGKATLVIHYAGQNMTIRITSIVKTEPKSVKFKFMNVPIGVGENIDKNNITLTATDYAGTVTNPTDFTIDFSPKAEAGTYPFTVSYKGFSETFNVTVK